MGCVTDICIANPYTLLVMIKIISVTSAWTYKKIVKPIIFKQSPDDVHERLLKAGAFLQNSKILRGIIHLSWSYTNHDYLSQTISGIQFANPIGLSAGFDKNFELVPLLKSVGFGLMEGGSITALPCAGNPRPWFYRLPKTQSIVVHAGLGNQGAAKIIRRIEKYKTSDLNAFPLNISVAKTNNQENVSLDVAIHDYITSLKIIKHSTIGQMITLNISCPNTYGGEPFTTPDRLDKLLTKVDKIDLHQPLFVKMPCDLPWDEFRKLLDVIIEHKVAGVTISNLAKNRKNITLLDPLPDSVKGNLSGKPVFELSNNLIGQTYKQYGDRLTIIGVGGVFSAEDAYTKIKLGASLVELITGMIFEGPQMVGSINYNLVKLLQNDGYSNVSQAIGSAHH